MVSRWFTNRYVNVLNANGTYTAKYYPSSGSKSFITSNLANLTGTVYTGPLKHELVLGTNGFDHNAYTVASLAGSAAQTLGISSLDNPTVYPSPSYRGMGGKYKASNTREQTFVQNDTVTFNDQWSVLAGVSESWLHVGNFNSTGAETSSSHASGAVSTTAALMFKPVQTVTTYISYGSSIQPGDSTSDVTAKNVNQVLAPYRSTQYEAGVKSSLSDIDLSAAAFYIERPFAAIDSSSYYRQLGNQDDLGVELTAKGRVTKDVTVFGGVTWLDTKLTDMGRAGSAYAADNGNKVVGIPEWQANLLTEYTVPNLRQLIASLNLHYTGRRAANAENTTWASGYFTTDIGARYQDAVMGHEVTWRAGIDNLFDKHYWASINGNMSGQSGAGNTAFLGDPRTVKASMSVKF